MPFVILLFACTNDEQNWTEVDATIYEEEIQELEEFTSLYLEQWANILQGKPFSHMEDFTVPNHHYYHMLRREYQNYLSQGVRENYEILETTSVETQDETFWRLSLEKRVETNETTEKRKVRYTIKQNNKRLVMTNRELLS